MHCSSFCSKSSLSFSSIGGIGMDRDPKVSKLLFPALFFIGSPVVVIDYSSREMDT
jgi:hypothetical protein